MEFNLTWVVAFLLIRALAFSVTLVCSQDQSGFVSIDCGLSKEGNYTEEFSSLYYVSDDGFVGTGINMDIAPNFISGTRKPLRSLRSFPTGIRNCYTIRPKQGKSTNYMIRATFNYANYDSKNKTPEFDLHLGTDVWNRVKFNYSTHIVKYEIIYTPSADYLYVCLANIGLGTPFISLIEVRHLSSSIYNRFSGSLELLGRYYTDTRRSNNIRYKNDVYDRIWVPKTLNHSTNISTTFDVDSSSNPFMLPSLAMQAATTMKNKDDPLVIPLTYLKPVEGNSTSQFFIYLHFAELIKLSANETREFTLSIKNLSSNGLIGSIAYSFSNLTSLQILDLSNNSLTGKIPESLASLPSLRILNLSMNKLTGSIPQSLLKKAENGLTLSLNGNPDLCSSSTCIPRKKKSIVIPALASVGALISLGIILGILFLIKKRKTVVPDTATEQTGLPHQLTYNRKDRGIPQYSYAEVVDMTKGFEKELGKGGFAVVYYGCLKDGTQVAVKRLYFTAHGLEQFETEIELLMAVCHKNLVSVLGYCDEGENLVLIYEYMVNGDLQRVIAANDAQTWKQGLKIAIDAAQGLDHLHQGCTPPIVHRDVKSSNILLNEDLEAKVADFGISKIFPDKSLTHVTTKVMGTFGYLDPDYFVTLKLKDKSDVYSFGVVLLELMTGLQAIIEVGSEKMSLVDMVTPLVETRDTWSVVDQRLKDSIHNQSSTSRFVDVAMSCLKRKAIERPSMGQVVMDLKECLAMEMDNKNSDTIGMSIAVASSATNPGER